MPKLFINIDELAASIGVSRNTLRRLIDLGQVPRGVKMSHGVLRWPIAQIERWAGEMKLDS